MHPKWDERSRHNRERFGIRKLQTLPLKRINEKHKSFRSVPVVSQVCFNEHATSKILFDSKKSLKIPKG
jgi:hypothetical protein